MTVAEGGDQGGAVDVEPVIQPEATEGAAAVARARLRFVVAAAALAVVVPLALGAARWPRWWRWIASENTPMTWVQSTVLVLASAAAALVSLLLHLRREPASGRRPWLLLAAGFAALALDERFALHERVRDRVLAPRDISIPFLPWVGPGDFLVMAVAVAGLALLPSVWRAVSADLQSRRALAVGVVLAAVAVGMDSIDPSTWSLHAERIEQSAEEALELGSGLCFLTAVVLRLLGLLPANGAPDETTPDIDQPLRTTST